MTKTEMFVCQIVCQIDWLCFVKSAHEPNNRIWFRFGWRPTELCEQTFGTELGNKCSHQIVFFMK